MVHSHPKLLPSSHEAVWSDIKGKKAFQSTASLFAKERERRKSFLRALSPCLNPVHERVGLPNFYFLHGENNRNSKPILE